MLSNRRFYELSSRNSDPRELWRITSPMHRITFIPSWLLSWWKWPRPGWQSFIHRARGVTESFDDLNDVNHLPWPLQCPDFNSTSELDGTLNPYYQHIVQTQRAKKMILSLYFSVCTVFGFIFLLVGNWPEHLQVRTQTGGESCGKNSLLLSDARISVSLSDTFQQVIRISLFCIFSQKFANFLVSLWHSCVCLPAPYHRWNEPHYSSSPGSLVEM